MSNGLWRHRISPPVTGVTDWHGRCLLRPVATRKLPADGISDLRLLCLVAAGLLCVAASSATTAIGLVELLFIAATGLYAIALGQLSDNGRVRSPQNDQTGEQFRCVRRVTDLLTMSSVEAPPFAMIARLVRETLGARSVHLVPLAAVNSVVGLPAAGLEAIEQRQLVRYDDDGHQMLAVPLLNMGEPVGVLVVEYPSNSEVEGSDVAFCRTIAHCATLSIQIHRSQRNVTELDRTRSEFLSNLSHGLRTPLNAIIGYTEILQATAAARELEVSGLVDKIETNGARLCGHVENLLQLSRLELGREWSEISRVDLRSLLDESFRNAQMIGKQKPLRFSLDMDPEIGTVLTDGGKVTRIVNGLLLNAVKFTHCGSVSVAARFGPGAPGQERTATISVHDTGIGIPEAEIPKLFQNFRRVDGSETSTYEGLGIGLAVTRRLTDLLGGAVDVQSHGAEGTTFRISLPVLPVAAPARDQPRSPTGADDVSARPALAQAPVSSLQTA